MLKWEETEPLKIWIMVPLTLLLLATHDCEEGCKCWHDNQRHRDGHGTDRSRPGGVDWRMETNIPICEAIRSDCYFSISLPQKNDSSGQGRVNRSELKLMFHCVHTMKTDSWSNPDSFLDPVDTQSLQWVLDLCRGFVLVERARKTSTGRLPGGILMSNILF